MLRLSLLLIALGCGIDALHANELGNFPAKTRVANLFKAQAESGGDKSAEEPSKTLIEASKWRSLNAEIWGGIVASKHTTFSAGLGFGFKLMSNLSLNFRLEYNQELGTARSYRPQVRAAYFEPTVRFHFDFDPMIAFYTDHGLSASAGYYYYQVDERITGSGVGKVFMLTLGTAHTAGLEFGDDFTRGFIETGLRTNFALLQSADRSVRGFQDNLREDGRFQWLVFRAGLRLYF